MSSEDSQRARRKNMLLSYYNADNANKPPANLTNIHTDLNETKMSADSFIANQAKDAYDINSSAFNSDLFLRRIIKVNLDTIFSWIVERIKGKLKIEKEKTLSEIMDFENSVVSETRKLDSEMQTLVSENYNKFISVTDTIRKVTSFDKRQRKFSLIQLIERLLLLFIKRWRTISNKSKTKWNDLWLTWAK